MIDGMVMDVPGIGKNRYETFEELELYCYRVAGTVGLMVLPILGTAKGVSEEDAKFPALSLGIALQLTNILRCVAVFLRLFLLLFLCSVLVFCFSEERKEACCGGSRGKREVQGRRHTFILKIIAAAVAAVTRSLVRALRTKPCASWPCSALGAEAVAGRKLLPATLSSPTL